MQEHLWDILPHTKVFVYGQQEQDYNAEAVDQGDSANSIRASTYIANLIVVAHLLIIEDRVYTQIHPGAMVQV